MDAVVPPRCLGCAGCPISPAASTTSPRPMTSAAPATTTTRSPRSPPRPAADRACSTSAPAPGASPSPLLEKGFDVVAVEPLDEMRAILTLGDRLRSGPGRACGGAAAARRERRRRRLQRRLALVRRRPRRRRAGARGQARRRHGGVRDAPALARQRRRARLVARPRRHPRRPAEGRPPLPHGLAPPDGLEGHPAFEEIQRRDEPFVHATDRARHRRALGIHVVRRDAPGRSAHPSPQRARRDARPARHRRRSRFPTGPSCGSLGGGQRQRRGADRRAAAS